MKKVDLIVNFKIQNSILIASLSKKTKKRTLSLLAADIILHKDAVKMVVWKTEAIHHVYVVTMKYNQWAICAKMVRPRPVGVCSKPDWIEVMVLALALNSWLGPITNQILCCSISRAFFIFIFTQNLSIQLRET